MKFKLLLTACCLSVIAPLKLSAIDIFLDFPGATDTEGNATDQGREGWSEVLSFSGGLENNINIGSITAGGGAGKATFKELVITKPVDTTSTNLMSRLASGTHFDDVVIEVTRPSGSSGAPPVIFKYELKLVLVSDIEIETMAGDDTLVEKITLQYGAHRISTFHFNAQGQPVTGSPKIHEWSRVLNQANFAVE